MVCRENKGRSALMGYLKAQQKNHGDAAFHDAEVQSLIHEARHELEAMDNEQLTVKEQLNFIEQMKQKIESDPDITDADKYRPNSGARGRTGLITRLNEEAERIRTGKSEGGSKLTNAQKNSMAHMLAMMKMGRQAEEIVPARNKFLEMNARHRGLSMDDVTREYNALMRDKGDFSQGSGATNGFRDSLSMAGLTASEQNSLSMSGRSLRALTEMERRRHEAVRTLASRPTRDASDEPMVFDKSGTSLKCSECGQFGHEGHSCPNPKEAATLKKIAAGIDRTDEIVAYWTIKQDTEAFGDDPADTVFGVYLKEVESKHPNGVPSLAKAEASRMDLLEKENKIRDTLRKASDKDIKTEKVKKISWNAESGVMVVEYHDSDRPAEARRVTKEQFDRFEERGWNTGDFDSAWEELVRDNTNAQFENPADEEAALVQHKCPTCGRWASLNSSHQCPVAGGPTEQHLAETMKARRENLGMEPRINSEDSRNWIHSSRSFRSAFILNGERIDMQISPKRCLKPAYVAQASQEKPLLANYDVGFSDGHVSGRMAYWNNPDGDGIIASPRAADTIEQGTSLRCNCEVYKRNRTCKHIKATAFYASKTIGQHTPVQFARPETPIGGAVSDTEYADISNIGDRVNYSVLRERKEEETRALIERVQTDRANPLANDQLSYAGPVNAQGDAAEFPDGVFTRTNPNTGKDYTVDVLDDKAYLKEMRAAMKHKAARNMVHPDGRKRRDMRVSVTLDKHTGGVFIDATQPMKNRGPRFESFARQRIAENLGISVNEFGPRGYYVAGDSASRIEFLHRAHKETPQIFGPGVVYAPTGETIRAAIRRTVLPRREDKN